MKLLILDGSPVDDPMGEKLFSLLSPQLKSKGHEAELIVLRDKYIANCVACFSCWFKSPGICTFDDDSGDISRKLMQSDVVVFLTPVTFGVYAPELKSMVDHLIANISPLFCTLHGETHHRKRYKVYPDVMTIGWLDSPDLDSEGIFRHLAYRNAINFHAASAVSGIFYRNQDDAVMRESLHDLLVRIERRDPPVAPTLPTLPVSHYTGEDVRRVALLVGSPRMENSSSASLGGYLAGRFDRHGVKTDCFYLHRVLKSEQEREQMLQAIDHADLTILAFPLYIDSLPAPMLSAMRIIFSHRQSIPVRSRLTAIANCGFLEASQNENALAACGRFARSSGFDWAGSISVGGGEGLVGGRPLAELGGPVTPVKAALDRVAEALYAGDSIPEESRMQLSRPYMPGWLYRLAGTRGWKKRARQFGTLGRLNDRPWLRDEAVRPK